MRRGGVHMIQRSVSLLGGMIAAGAIAAVVGACAPATPSPTEPAGAIRMAPSAEYRAWWAETEQCSDLAADPSEVTWYVVPGVSMVPTPDHGEVAAYYDPRGRAITLAGFYAASAAVVRHEALHALLAANGIHARGHPPLYFRDRCGPLVASQGSE
jgi:hypothetical protein